MRSAPAATPSGPIILADRPVRHFYRVLCIRHLVQVVNILEYTITNYMQHVRLLESRFVLFTFRGSTYCLDSRKPTGVLA